MLIPELIIGQHKLRTRSIPTCVSQLRGKSCGECWVDPVLVSQCQAIHARSLVPCQDTPDVKSTYEFKFRASLPVLASGLFTGVKDFQPGENSKAGTLLYTFRQDVPIPSYLFAVASGYVESRKRSFDYFLN